MADEKEQEKGYEVKDKRRVNPDGTLREEAEGQGPAEEGGAQNPPEEMEAEAAAEQQAAAEGRAPEEQAPPGAEAAEGPELPLVDVYTLLSFMAAELATKAWEYMGVRLPMGRKEPIKDMVQAKLAIDTLIFISDKLHPHMSEEDRRATRMLISDLQLNFVQHGQ